MKGCPNLLQFLNHYNTTTNNSYGSVPYQSSMYAGICTYNQQYQARPVGGNGTVHCMGAGFINTMNMCDLISNNLHWEPSQSWSPHWTDLFLFIFFLFIYIVINYVPLVWVYYNIFTRTKTLRISTVPKARELLQWKTQTNQPKYPSEILSYCSVSVSTLQTTAMDKYVTQSMPF